MVFFSFLDLFCSIYKHKRKIMKVYTTKDILEIEERYNSKEDISRYNKIWFQNIPGTRKAGIKFLMYDYEIREYIKCFNSIEYFTDYCNIKNEDGAVGKIELRDYQKEILKQFDNKYSIILKSRQMGITAVLIISLLHFMLFNENKTIVIMANKGMTVREIMRKFKDIYKLLPFYLKQGIVNWNEKQIVFENGSRIVTMARSIEIPDSYKDSDVFYIDEFAKIPENIIVPMYMKIFQNLKEDARLIIASSPSGFNLFYELVQRSELPTLHPDKNMFKTLRLYWWQVPGRQDTKLRFIDSKLKKYNITKETVLENLKDMDLDIYDKKIDDETYYFIKYNAYNRKTYISEIRKIDFNNVPLSDISRITNWKEEMTLMVGGEDVFRQEYDLSFTPSINYYKDSLDKIIFIN